MHATGQVIDSHATPVGRLHGGKPHYVKEEEDLFGVVRRKPTVFFSRSFVLYSPNNFTLHEGVMFALTCFKSGHLE